MFLLFLFKNVYGRQPQIEIDSMFVYLFANIELCKTKDVQSIYLQYYARDWAQTLNTTFQ